jgi:hypothetical protein
MVKEKKIINKCKHCGKKIELHRTVATQVYTAQALQALLDRSNPAVERALVVLYNRQTLGEQATMETRELNGRGFSGAHAEFGSSLAKWILGGQHLTPRQLVFARKIVKRYTRQLLEANREKISREG